MRTECHHPDATQPPNHLYLAQIKMLGTACIDIIVMRLHFVKGYFTVVKHNCKVYN